MRSTKHIFYHGLLRNYGECAVTKRLFNKAKRSRKCKDWNAYKSLKHNTNKALRYAHWQNINILLEGFQSKDCKPFWRFVKSKRQDTVGVALLKSKGNLFSYFKSKDTILNDQLKSVLTPTHDHNPDIPQLEGPNYPSIAPLVISSKGVEKLLSLILKRCLDEMTFPVVSCEYYLQSQTLFS